MGRTQKTRHCPGTVPILFGPPVACQTRDDYGMVQRLCKAQAHRPYAQTNISVRAEYPREDA